MHRFSCQSNFWHVTSSKNNTRHFMTFKYTLYYNHWPIDYIILTLSLTSHVKSLIDSWSDAFWVISRWWRHRLWHQLNTDWSIFVTWPIYLTLIGYWQKCLILLLKWLEQDVPSFFRNWIIQCWMHLSFKITIFLTYWHSINYTTNPLFSGDFGNPGCQRNLLLALW